MLQKKVCLLGAYAVGKTSLVARFVHSVFSATYHTTVGVKISKKIINVNDQKMKILLWDLAGDDEVTSIRSSYLHGASGYLFVVDGTRPNTLGTVVSLSKRVRSEIGDTPSVVLLNKVDLTPGWALHEDAMREIKKLGKQIFCTSALTGENVQAAFSSLAQFMM
jgi:hypothetical protein